MNHLVKQLVNDDGEIVEEDEQRWHLMLTSGGDTALVCTGEYVGEGCSSGNGEIYIFKQTQRAGITCETCLSIVRAVKAVKL